MRGRMKFYDCLKELENDPNKIFIKKDGLKKWQLSRSKCLYYNLVCLDGVGNIVKGDAGGFNGNMGDMNGWEEVETRKVIDATDAFVRIATGEKVYCEVDGRVHVIYGITAEQRRNGIWFVYK